MSLIDAQFISFLRCLELLVEVGILELNAIGDFEKAVAHGCLVQDQHYGWRRGEEGLGWPADVMCRRLLAA